MIYDLNVVKCHEIYYNEKNKRNLANYIKWGTLIFSKNIENISNIAESFLPKKEKDYIMAGIDKLTREDLFYTEEEALEWAEWERRSIETEIRNKATKEGLEAGMKQGIEQGIEQKTKEMIISLYNNNATLEFISKVTNKPMDEIKKIINKI